MSKNLKAYVRYDGNGRVVSSSLILSRVKPKVGKWKEIENNECCNSTTTTTTTNISTSTSTTTNNVVPEYTLGEFALGGRIVYILQPGDTFYDPNVQHGLVASISEFDNAVWGCSLLDIPGADGFGIGAGNENTTAMLAACPGVTGGEAAWFCNNLVAGGYVDWYLPSVDELSILSSLPEASEVLNVGSGYWSSTETNNGQGGAWAAGLLSNGFIQSYVTTKTELLRVKPYRSF